MKRFLVALMTLVLIVTSMAFPAMAADTWRCDKCNIVNSTKFCPECGAMRPEQEKCAGCGYVQPDGMTFKFCPNCGLQMGAPAPTATPKPTKRPTATPTPRPTATPKPSRTFEITGVTESSTGSVTITWKDSAGKAPYKVLYECFMESNVTGSLQQKQLRFTGESNVYGKSATLTRLVPGQSYWLFIRDADGDYATYAYHPGSCRNFPDFPVKLTREYRVSKGSEVSKISGLSAANMESGKHSYGMYVRLDYSQLKKERHYVGRVAVATPDGTILQVTYIEDFELPSGRSNTYWKMYNLDTAVANAKTMYGYVPTGTWTWSLYFDDMFVNSMDFTVGR